MGRGASKGGSGGSVKEFTSIDDAMEFFELQGMQELTQTEEIYTYAYTDTMYKDINNYLRLGMTPENTDDTLDAIKAIDSAIAKNNLTQKVVVNRGSDAIAFGFDHIPTQAELQGLVGRTFRDKGFVSTAAGNTGFAAEMSLEITVPPGKGRGIYLGGWTGHSAHPTESEFLLKRNARYKIVGVKNNKLQVEMLSR